MDEVLSALRKMYNIERFATQIYRTQMKAFTEKVLTDRLEAARANEQEHVDGLHARTVALGGKVSFWMGNIFQLAGKLLGFITTLFGKIFVFRADIMIEKKAVKDYKNFLQTIDFDDKSRSLIRKNLEDEKVHIVRWEDSISILTGKLTTAP